MKCFKLTVVGLAALLFLLLAACGGDDDSSDGGESDAPTATQRTNGEPTATNSDGEPTETEEADDGGDGNGSALHACDILTVEEVSQALGFEVGEGRDYLATAPDATQCEWPVAEGGAGNVYAEVLTEGGRDWYDAVHFGAGEGGFEVEDVDGIGDEATFDDLDALQVVDGDKYVQVQMVVFFSEVDDLTAAKGLAQAILGKLP